MSHSRIKLGYPAQKQRGRMTGPAVTSLFSMSAWLRGVDLNHRPLGYEPNELPDCSTPQEKCNTARRLETDGLAVQ